MDENMRKRNELLAQTVIKGLKSRNMSGYYAADKEEAVKLALELIPEGSSIAMGGCMSAQEIGLIQVLEDGNYNYTGATVEQLALMRRVSDPAIQIKAAGGVRTLDDLLTVRKLGVTRVGATATAAILDEAVRRLYGQA